jgi:hypothetical protein
MDGTEVRRHRGWNERTGSRRGLREADGKLRRRLVIAGALMPLAGCTVAEVSRSEPGIDVSAVAPGATRAQIETIVGEAQREWTTPLGVRFRLYRYFAGRQPATADVLTVILLEVASLGLYEGIRRVGPESEQQSVTAEARYRWVAVSYDESDVAIGVFQDVDQFTALPADGRPPPARPPADGPPADGPPGAAR